ncbi:hypothetical protein METBIDRAFT_172200 [Metschnikowia bicuspidata var. bicuspidata NRRL YB-4993]|uniref:Securin n=1 Tax=Metschnikowia bicuspidata var. bicuspidata NRRL YB-4993 TaxID=869754 RepID=A0A1A0HAZ3_9ASCO|nr:hypothetical protein METBIDRAFT_172200 [Metschnikowia bicuspidata var. bicuspidata NRRL YB-4993]OBA21052.1 hypothetical protein METBIDRAFT_172200 [Metschnikowia bicuspidata var. bicuspidata NRRL YB-4993]
MSTNRLKLHTDKENEHKIALAKNELRNPAHREIPAGTSVPTKRPLSAKSNINEKRVRVPLGGKNHNQAFPGLQRSKLSLPLTFQTPSLRQPGLTLQGDILSTKPTLTKSNLSLGFFNRVAKPSAPAPRPTNPHKNTLFPLQDLHRPKDLIPRFLSDDLIKAAPKALHPLQTSLNETLSDATAQLHASNVPSQEHFAKNRDPIKKGTFRPEIELLIEALAEDENSIETVPEAENREPLDYVPLGVSPLSKAEAPFLYEEEAPRKLTDMFAPDEQFFSDDEEQCSDAEKELNTAFYRELNGTEGNTALGLTAADLEDLLDF